MLTAIIAILILKGAMHTGLHLVLAMVCDTIILTTVAGLI